MSLMNSNGEIIKPEILYRKPPLGSYSEKRLIIDGRDVKAWVNSKHLIYCDGETVKTMTWYRMPYTCENEFRTYCVESMTGRRDYISAADQIEVNAHLENLITKTNIERL